MNTIPSNQCPPCSSEMRATGDYASRTSRRATQAGASTRGVSVLQVLCKGALALLLVLSSSSDAHAQSATYRNYLKAFLDTTNRVNDFFGGGIDQNSVRGTQVSHSGEYIAVGAAQESGGVGGINPPADESANRSGAVYVYKKTNGIWATNAKLKSSTPISGGDFGLAVSASDNAIAVGAPGEGFGAVYIFRAGPAGWVQETRLTASNGANGDNFGWSVRLSGETLVVGAPGSASTGAVYVYRRTGTTWTQEAYLRATNAGVGDQFGKSIAISGSLLVAGAPGESSNATGIGGNGLDDSMSNSGAAYFFRRTGTQWIQEAYVKASNTDVSDSFGGAIEANGDLVIVGAHQEDSAATGVNGDQASQSAGNAGAIYAFFRSPAGVWSQEAYIKASNANADDEFGCSLSLSANTLLVGAWNEDSGATGTGGAQGDNSASRSGACYLFRRNSLGLGGVWAQAAYIKASNTSTSDRFGTAVSLSGNSAVVGAPGEDSVALALNGDQSDNSESNAGAAYQYDIASDCNANGIDDQVEIAAGGVDCNANGQLDVCDLAAGAQDCDANGVLDACQPDVNLDGIADACQGGTPICFGDGQALNCPCSNNGAVGNGCANSTASGGANLASLGLPSYAFDSLAITVRGLPPNSRALLFQGRGASGAAAFGDGLRCVTGTLVRLGSGASVAGVYSWPQPGTSNLSAVGGIPSSGGVTRYYQAWYTDSDPSFCQSQQFNFTNALQIAWLP